MFGTSKLKVASKIIILFFLVSFSPYARAAVNGYAEVIAGSSPDNALGALSETIDGAAHSIRLSGYTFSSPFITDHLIQAAKRGVSVTLFLDGWTVARPKKQKIPPEELLNAYLLEQAGGKVIYLASNDGLRRDRRFKYQHSKYLIVDEETVFISSENFGTHAFSTTGTTGTRGWIISIKNADLAKEYVQIFDSDVVPKTGFNDLIRYGKSADYTLANPDSVKQDRSQPNGKYTPIRAKVVREEMRLERVMSPDDSLEKDRAILGALKTAQKTLYIQNLSFQPHWGPEGSSPAKDPSPVAEAVLAAARRGASVRIMLQPPIFGNLDFSPEYGRVLERLLQLPFQYAAGIRDDDDEESSPKKSTKDNKALIEYFRKVARRESLDLQANMFWVEKDSLNLLHNKGMVIDGDISLISSINWTQNSIKQNREAAVIVMDQSVADYYQDLFLRDWDNSRNHGLQQ